MNAGGQIHKENLVASMANNVEIKILNSIESNITINNENINLKFYIMENLSQDFILEIDFLNKCEIQFLLKNKKLLRDKFKIEVGSMSGVKGFLNKENKILENFLSKEKELFEGIEGNTPLIKHEIKLESSTPLKQRYR